MSFVTSIKPHINMDFDVANVPGDDGVLELKCKNY